jgi:hypothetical protein
METSEAHTPLHLKIKAWHKNQKRSGEPPSSTKVFDFKSVILPRQHLLKKLDPAGEKTVEEVNGALLSLVHEYLAMVVHDEATPDLGVEHALDVYESHLLDRATTWGKVPVQCTCVHSCRDCICEHGTLFAHSIRLHFRSGHAGSIRLCYSRTESTQEM